MQHQDYDRYINDTPSRADYERMASDYVSKQRKEYRTSVIRSAIAITILFIIFLIILA